MTGVIPFATASRLSCLPAVTRNNTTGLCRQHLTDATHLAADVRLGDLRIAPCHVRIRMTQNLGDDIDRHPVFNRQRGKRMARQVRGQMLVDLANIRYFLQVGVHLRIRRDRQQLAPRPTVGIVAVLLQQSRRLRKHWNTAHHRGLFPRLMDPQLPLLVRREMFPPQVVDIREGQSRQRAKAEDIPDAVQPLVGHWPPQQQVQFRLRQRLLDIRLVDLHLIVTEGIFLDPFVADRIEQEVFQTAEQIDGSVVVAVIGRLHVGVQSIDVGIVDRLQREVLFVVDIPDIFGHVAQQAVVLVGRELRDAGADLLLPFLAVFAELRQQHPTRRGGAQQLFDGKAGRRPVLLDQSVVGGQDRGPVAGDDTVDLLVDLILVERTFEALVPAIRLNLALRVDFGRLAGRGDAGIDRGLALFRDFGLLAEEDNAEGGSWQHGCLVFE